MWRARTASPSPPVERKDIESNRHCSEEIPDLLREAFRISTWMHQTGKTIWVTTVKQLFDKAGMLFAFTPQGCGRRIIEKVMICYRDQFIQLWDSELIVDRVREVKQETNYELTDCSSPDSNWRVTSLKSRWQNIA